MRSPFKFLDSYGIRDKDDFFGREKEVDALYSLVFKTPLTLLYGLSGTGKTSIIQCGLANRFDGPDWLPFFIRREQDINQSLRKSLAEALDEPGDKELPDIIAALFDDYLRPVYLIFDQFEELFILGSPEEQASFAASLRQLVERKLPCRIILVIREEYLGQLYPLEKEIPSLFDHRLRIEPMNNARVLEVLEKSFGKFNISLEAPAPELRQAIIDNVSAGKSGIQLPYLQVYLDMLYREDFQRDYGERERGEDLPPLEFTHQEVKDFGKIDDVLDKFLREQAEVLQAGLSARHPGLPENAVRLVLDAFVTEDGTKRPVFLESQEGLLAPEARYKALFPDIPPRALTDCLRQLEQSRLLRITDDSAELAHDSLASLIDRQRTDEQRQLNEVKRRIAAAHLEREKTGVWPTERQLLSLEEFLPKLHLEPHLQQFMQDSSDEVDRRKQEAEAERQRKLEEAQRQADEERRLKEKAQLNEQRARQRTRLAAVVSVLALGLALLAGWSYLQANEAKKAATISAKEASGQRAEALRQKSDAEAARVVADSNALVARQKTDQANAALKLADENLLKAKEEERKTKAALEQVKKEQAATEEQRKIAEDNSKKAEEATKTAQAERDNAAAALSNLEKKNTDVVRLILANADRDILNLRYEEALEKIKSAASLGALKEETARYYLEIAFWHGESGNTDRAAALLDSIAVFTKNKGVAPLLRQLPTESAAAREQLRQAMKAVDADHFRFLFEEKYYPEMVLVEGGKFQMGCDPAIESVCFDWETLHWQEVSSFKIARTETTVWQFALYCAALPELDIQDFLGSTWSDPGDNPVVNVTWYNSVDYSNWVSRQKGEEEAIIGDEELNYQVNLRAGYRLPTEAEWEYAAKGGKNPSRTIYSGSKDPDSVAWYYENSGSRTRPVGKKMANSLGLHDMSGNAWEWCMDWYEAYADNPEKDYCKMDGGSNRVLRGGSWHITPADLRCAYRYINSPGDRYDGIGFRLARAAR